MGIAGFTKEDLKQAYEEHFTSIRNFLYYKAGDIELAEDLVQEVFIKLWEKRSDIRSETVKSLLFTMANNLLINHFNHLKVVRNHEGDQIREDRKELNTPQFQMEEQEFGEKLNRILAKLPDGSREVFLMNRIEKIKYDEIAERLGISVKAVEKRMSKALSILREEIGRKI